MQYTIIFSLVRALVQGFPWDFPPDYSKLDSPFVSITEETNDECLLYKSSYKSSYKSLYLKSNLYRFSDFLVFTSSHGKNNGLQFCLEKKLW